MGDLLVACVNQMDDVVREQLAGPIDAGPLLGLALYHGVEGAVYSAVRSHPFPQDVLYFLRAGARNAVARHMRALADLAWLRVELESKGIDWVVMKGPILAELAYGTSSVRTYTDLDVLVDPAAFGETVRALEIAGASLIDQNWPMMHAEERGELSMILPHGTPLDLHWHVFMTPELRSEFPVATRVLLSHRRKVTIANQSIPTLDETDTLVHLATHATFAGGHRLAWLKDIERLVASEQPDWSELVERAHTSSLDAPVAIALARSQRVLGTLVSDRALASMYRGIAWQRGIAALDRVRPPHYAQPGVLSASLLLRSTRSTSTRSVSHFVRSTFRFARRDLLANPEHPWRARGARASAPSPPNPLHLTTGGHRDRLRYFAAVADSGRS